MNQYVNAFDCAINPSREEVVILWKQNYPVFSSEHPSNPKVETEKVCSIVMNADIARSLVDVLSEMLKAESENKETEGLQEDSFSEPQRGKI